jgi:hypothetical protein
MNALLHPFVLRAEGLKSSSRGAGYFGAKSKVDAFQMSTGFETQR